MLLQPGILRKPVRLVPWDIQESRGDRHLLVWAGVPHWMVVDGEMLAFLGRLDGTTPLGRTVEPGAGSPQVVAKTVKQLLKRGVVEVAAESGKSQVDRPEPRLESIAVNVTARCNLTCSFCYARHERAGNRAEEVSAGHILAFLRAARPMMGRPCSLVLLGGEPFLEPAKLLAVAAQGRRWGLSAIVSSNGTLITPELAREARRARLQVQVSLDGCEEPTHERVRGRGTWDRALRGLRALVQARVHTVISMVCHRDNLHQLEGLFDLARELGVQEARFIPLKQIGAARDCQQRPVPMNELMAAARAIFERRPELRSLLGRDALSILANTCRYSARRPSCGTGLHTVLLDADGRVYPCLNLTASEFRVGSVRDAGFDFGQVWRHSSTLGQLRRATSVENPQRACSRCPVRYWCLGGCRGETLARTGDLSGPAADCSTLRRTMLDMMWMLAESPDLVRPAVRIC